jgi:hypothetical protein
MKKHTNGAACPAVDTSTAVNPIAQDSLMAVLYRKEKERKAQHERREGASKSLTINVTADTYGMLCAAGVVNDGTPEEMAAMLLLYRACDWANDDYPL